ncbi:septal ring lytic transglycosylase RlpA family protein [Desulfoplanes formicivorans]|uniref:Probable endolytic peptidoglycan transglycosylase RlpA n=1 Tax=Desulfoplanes formicivorans TaxID=1592317 RepID=A0A194AHB6_9BACT|nr:septal ring lytic transglycosylase RlpA family protein [Desulfoplanes formicivorans]GAU08723.1 lipoprotein A [Desulfoplanes formicivorans]
MNQQTSWPALLITIMACLLVGTGCGQKIAVDHGRPAPPRTSTPPKHKATQKTYTVMGQTYTPLPSATNYTETGIASWYGSKFHGRLTASGEVYDMHQRTAAHRVLPMQTWLTVTNLDNGKTTRVRVNDRGPFVKNRILDLSFQAAKDLGIVGPGTARVRIQAEGTRTTWLTGPFYVQVGSFTIKDNALKVCSKMQQQGYAQSRIHPINLNGQTFWQVHAGSFATMADAQSALKRLAVQSPSSFILAD